VNSTYISLFPDYRITIPDNINKDVTSLITLFS